MKYCLYHQGQNQQVNQHVISCQKRKELKTCSVFPNIFLEPLSPSCSIPSWPFPPFCHLSFLPFTSQSSPLPSSCHIYLHAVSIHFFLSPLSLHLSLLPVTSHLYLSPLITFSCHQISFRKYIENSHGLKTKHSHHSHCQRNLGVLRFGNRPDQRM